MAALDVRGVPVGSDSAAARDALESATWRLMSF
jgi:hypothetical protein